MKKPTLYLLGTTLALVSTLALAPLTVPAQTAPTPSAPAHSTPTRTASTKAPAHRPTTASAAGTPLPKNIPVVAGIPKSLYALRYIDIKPGTGEAAMPGWSYSVHYTGWFYDGTKFDSSLDRGNPIDFVQGRRAVIAGWDTGFDGMKVGGKRRLLIPYQLAYGEQGRPGIPPKANLIFDIELVNQHDPNAPPPAPSPVPGATATPPTDHPMDHPETEPKSTTQPQAKPE